MAIITISRQYGSGGNEIAELICQKTGYRLFDKGILSMAAAEAGLSAEEVVDFSEDDFKVKNFMERLLRRSHPVAQTRVWEEDVEGLRKVKEIQLDEELALTLITRAIETAYKLGNVVIVGRGGQVILRNYPGVLHVRVEAPFEERIRRLRNSPEFEKPAYTDSVGLRRRAQTIIEKNDAASADYLKRFYDIDWEDPMLYHMVINTDKLKIEQAAKLMIMAAEMVEEVEEPA